MERMRICQALVKPFPGRGLEVGMNLVFRKQQNQCRLERCEMGRVEAERSWGWTKASMIMVRIFFLESWAVACPDLGFCRIPQLLCEV